MTTADDDALDLLDHAWGRVEGRMEGLTDEEWAWCPVASDPRIGISWRLAHLASMLAEPRNAAFLGRDADPPPEVPSATSAASARSALATAYAAFRDTAAAADLDREIGAAAGPYGSASRRSFVLHVADELIHHGAEAALLRDLYAGRYLPRS